MKDLLIGILIQKDLFFIFDELTRISWEIWMFMLGKLHPDPRPENEKQW